MSCIECPGVTWTHGEGSDDASRCVGKAKFVAFIIQWLSSFPKPSPEAEWREWSTLLRILCSFGYETEVEVMSLKIQMCYLPNV